MPDSPPPRLLLVEDEFLIRMTLAEALADEGFAVTEADSFEAAAALLRAEPFDLLLTDLQLPGACDGRALVAQARAARADLPAIVMSGRPDDARPPGEAAREVFIAKPYVPSQVCAAARRLLGLA